MCLIYSTDGAGPQAEKISSTRPLIAAIEGVSLAGKTTLCKTLSSSPETKYVPELSVFHNEGDGFPLISKSDEAAKKSDAWFFMAELERQSTWNSEPNNTKLVILDRSFVSMIIFGIARKLLYGIGEPWRTAKCLFESDLAVGHATPVHLYLKIGSDDYIRRKESANELSKKFNQPGKRVRFDEQHESFIHAQIELYDLLFGLDEVRILTGKEKTSEIIHKAASLKLRRENKEDEYLRIGVDRILSRFGLPDTRH